MSPYKEFIVRILVYPNMSASKMIFHGTGASAFGFKKIITRSILVD